MGQAIAIKHALAQACDEIQLKKDIGDPDDS